MSVSRSADRGAPKSRDRELEAGAAAHFEDPAYYTQTYAPRRADVAYYRALAEERGAVLEHGIGNGRIAIAMAVIAQAALRRMLRLMRFSPAMSVIAGIIMMSDTST